MKEAKILGELLPSHPDLIPIIEAIRNKYGLEEVPLDGDPIEEIFLHDKPVALKGFRQDIKKHLLRKMDFLSPDFVLQYKLSKFIVEIKEIKGVSILPKSWKEQIQNLVNSIKNFFKPLYQILDANVDAVVDMLYIYILTGETREAPSDWFGKVITMKNSSGNAIIIAMASQAADPEFIVKEFQAEYKKTFGEYRPKVTKTLADTSYYLQLRMRRKPWNFIVEEYIRIEKPKLPKRRTSQKYIDAVYAIEQKLKKRIQRTKKILEVILEDKK